MKSAVVLIYPKQHCSRQPEHWTYCAADCFERFQLAILISFLLFCAAARTFAQPVSFWKETFEEDDVWTRWHDEGSIWSIDTPTGGPGRAFAGDRCAGTVLAGEFITTDARLVRDRVFIVPSASQNPRLRFWQWYQGDPGAIRSVELRVGTGPWQALTAVLGWDTDGWGYALFDLSPFSGEAVQIAFHFQTENAPVGTIGWFVDEVEVQSGPAWIDLTQATEGFEAGFGMWAVDNPGWQSGTPPLPVSSAFAGTNCVGVGMQGPYPPDVDSRLISPDFVVPSTPQQPRLRFWHWFSFGQGDTGWAEIRVSGGDWQNLSQVYGVNGGGWTRPSLDLRPYANQSVQVAFHFRSDAAVTHGPGWFVDEVTVETSPAGSNLPTFAENFEAGLGGWAADNGVWQVGTPTAGPGTAASGTQCAGTVLAGSYPPEANSHLVSPEFTVPAAGATISFAQWFSFGSGAAGWLEMRLSGGRWQQLLGPFTGSTPGWQTITTNLSGYAGQTVQLGFRFNSGTSLATKAGWYIDDVLVAAIQPPQLVISRLAPDVLQICVLGGVDGALYTLEAADGVSSDPASATWTTIVPSWSACEPIYSTSSTAQIFRARRVE